MSAQQDDKTIVALLEQAIGQEFGAKAEYNQYGQLITLNLSNLGLTSLPPELTQLSNLQTTHGIEVDSLTLPHPFLPAYTLTLNTWDFGGQDIYRATHQFFLTKRSLYLVVWNARLGGEQGRLDYWLSTIRALAPDAPVDVLLHRQLLKQQKN